MRIARKEQAVSNIVFGTINKLITIVLSFLIRTIAIYILGIEYLGLNGLFVSILQILNLSEMRNEQCNCLCDV